MSDSNRLQRIAIGASLIAILLFSFILAELVRNNAILDQIQVARNSERDIKRAKDESLSSFFIYGLAAVKCGQAQNLEDLNLCAQFQMAAATRDQARYALFSLAFLIFTFCTAAWAAWEARKAAIASAGNVAIAADTAERQLRAYIGVQEIKLVLKTVETSDYRPADVTLGGKISDDYVSVQFGNFGQTPGNRVRIWVNWIGTNYGHRLPEDFSFDDYGLKDHEIIRPTYSVYTVFPGQEFTTHVYIRDISLFFKANKREIHVFVYGHIDYLDIYGESRSSKFCYIYDMNSSVDGEYRLVPYEKHNEAI